MGSLQLVAKADCKRKIAFKEESGFLLQQSLGCFVFATIE